MSLFLRLLKPFLKAVAFFIHILPYPVHWVLAWLIALVWFDVLRIRRKDAIENVRKAFPDLTSKKARQLARGSLFHMGLTLLEFYSFPFLWKEDFDRLFQTQGMELLDEAFAQGKGVFLMSLHIGNGDLGAAALACWGYPMHIISKVFKTKWLNDLWFGSRRKRGLRFIAPRKSTYEILKALKANHGIIFVLDQYTGPPNGVVTEFFGHKTGTAMGLALFAKKSGAPVLPVYTYRIGPKKHQIVVEPPIPFEEHDNPEETIRYMTQKYTDCIERIVRDHKEQWMWVHRRWKIGFAEQLETNKET
ncbi:MAG: lysophospholipid acyltransferase family protein [Bdellovibrionales bacterium]|nr:lysophospholipid acyltransferase family protein [Bdellovibrionales bacterium]